ncbi:ABC transporter B family member 5 [Hibiscus syriacus]|uniref:ABC transporter B family member 5 n=1 Tax=Hibiscus syriacus TaxID=106335 RepID=A0A6A2XUE1_HIBSY|nr:ABC transporter B family member 5 [Hibiscus syriacus]
MPFRASHSAAASGFLIGLVFALPTSSPPHFSNGSVELQKQLPSAMEESMPAGVTMRFILSSQAVFNFSFADSRDIMLMIIGTINAIGNGLCMPLVTILFGDLADAFGQNQSNNKVVDVVSKVALRLVYLAVGAGLAAFLQVSCWMVTGKRQAARIREVVGRMSGDTVLIQDAMGEKVGKVLQLVSTFFGGFIVAFIRGWLLTLVMLSTIPLLVISGGTTAVLISKTASRGQSTYAKSATVVERTIGSVRTVASFTGEKKAISNYNKFLVAAYKSGVNEGTVAGLGYTGGEVLNVILAVMTGSRSLRQASPCLSAFAAGQAAAFKMFETIKRKPEIDPYDTRRKVLKEFVGSGSGKSTVISLIERFYDPQAGEVLIDGINLKDFQLRCIRGKISLVSQEPVLFTSSIRDNTAYGKEYATLEEIRAADELAIAAKFRQTTSGARNHGWRAWNSAFWWTKEKSGNCKSNSKGPPRILLLDEATSVLDAESERVVQEALDQIMGNRTTVIVAHRLSTVRNADMIAVILRGKMVEKGLICLPIVMNLQKRQEVKKTSKLAKKNKHDPDSRMKGKVMTEDSDFANDVYEYEDEVPQEESRKNRRFDPVDNYEYEIPEDFEDVNASSDDDGGRHLRMLQVITGMSTDAFEDKTKRNNMVLSSVE